jgi:two-component system nitrate/nitrite response regulator NarL
VTSILRVDDHPRLRQGVAQLIELEEGLSVIGEAGSGKDALGLATELDPEELLRSIMLASQRQPVFSPQLARILASGVRDNKGDLSELMARLTSRETQILQCIAQGKTNKNIARELNIAEATVKVHVKNLLKKIELRSRVEAAVWVLENRLFD